MRLARREVPSAKFRGYRGPFRTIFQGGGQDDFWGGGVRVKTLKNVILQAKNEKISSWGSSGPPPHLRTGLRVTVK